MWTKNFVRVLGGLNGDVNKWRHAEIVNEFFSGMLIFRLSSWFYEEWGNSGKFIGKVENWGNREKLGKMGKQWEIEKIVGKCWNNGKM